MTTMTIAPTTAADVRAWFAENENLIPETVQPHTLKPGARGRIHPDARAVFNKHNKGRRYTEGTPKTMPLPYKHTQPSGRKVTKVAHLPVSKVRELAGVESARGVLSKAAISKASENYAKHISK